MAKVYKIKFNDKNEKVCIINGKEVKVVSETEKYIFLEDGTSLEAYVDLKDPLTIQTSDEGEMRVSAGGKTIEFCRTCPSRGVIGESKKIISYRVVGKVRGVELTGEYARRKGTVEYYIDESDEGTAVVTREKEEKNGKRRKQSEFLINESGSDLGSDGIYSRPSKVSNGGSLIPPIPPDPPSLHKQYVPPEFPKIPGPNYPKPAEKSEKKPKRKWPFIIPIILAIPIVAQSCYSCNRCSPDEKPQPESSISDISEPNPNPNPDLELDLNLNPDPNPNPNPDQDPDYIVDLSEVFLEGVKSFDADLTQIKSSSYSESEAIYYDLQSYVDGDLDDNLKIYLGDEYVNLRSGDGVPSSLNKKLNSEFALNDDQQKIVHLVNDIIEISRMDINDIKNELNSKNITPVQHGIQNTDLELIASLIKDRTNFDIFNINDLETIINCFEQYAKEQVESREKLIGIKENHKITTQKSLNNRPNQEAIDSYKKEIELHSESLLEEENKKTNDVRQLEIIEEIKQTLQQIHSYILNGQNVKIIQNSQINSKTTTDVSKGGR